ncbi:pyruvate dehydrogenase (acetyl-transferring) kinase, mitochondrial [Canna indica]|uniref:Protein-serine/threonine kinase n=1 Tax=Canna indica TaxID=4628 RepID=A0AAQ3KK44_9LILI|nr:pyruvate dehydrogenase (acetyl-transferring) kinase, mitochondrial [Canna indica]
MCALRHVYLLDVNRKISGSRGPLRSSRPFHLLINPPPRLSLPLSVDVFFFETSTLDRRRFLLFVLTSDLIAQIMAVKKAAESFSKALAEEVHRWGGMKQTGVSLRYMMEFGARPTQKNLLISAQFLHKELPIRIARRAIELESLPFGLSEKPAVLKVLGTPSGSMSQEVRDWYLDSFRDLTSFPEIRDTSNELAFTRMIKMIKVRHNNVVPAMALGVQQLKRDLNRKVVPEELEEIHQFLDRFYMSRIGIRMLIGQHVALHDPDPEPGCIGQINTRLSPMLVARAASEDARSVCFREYGVAPEVDIYGDPKFTFPYVPSHLHLMVFELVKNSLRAVQERFMNSDKDAPPVRIIVADGIEDVTIKISDEGGGIPRSGLRKIFTYLYSTAKNPLDENCEGVSDGVTMAGYGYGLPISRLYARYFGGDLQIISMEGYGTDAYLHLSRLGDSQEPLP